MQELKITVTIDEANLILEGLGNLPFEKVYAVVSKIQEQANQQLADDDWQGNPSADPPSPPQVQKPNEE